MSESKKEKRMGYHVNSQKYVWVVVPHPYSQHSFPFDRSFLCGQSRSIRLLDAHLFELRSARRLIVPYPGLSHQSRRRNRDRGRGEGGLYDTNPL